MTNIPRSLAALLAALTAGLLAWTWRTGRGPFRTIPVGTIYSNGIDL